MTQENKDLLLKDLSTRLPYGVKFSTKYKNHKDIVYELIAINKHSGIVETFGTIWFNIEDIKPYLRPLSSMTEEEDKEYTDIDNRSYSCPKDYAHTPASDRIDWLNKHHFDYRGLIEKGLAVEVTETDNPYKDKD